MKQQTFRFRKPRRSTVPPDLSRHDFGPADGFYYRTPIKLQERGFSYRYGLPANKLTVGRPLCDQTRFDGLPLR